VMRGTLAFLVRRCFRWVSWERKFIPKGWQKVAGGRSAAETSGAR
jgi:hypothetical protein